MYTHIIGIYTYIQTRFISKCVYAYSIKRAEMDNESATIFTRSIYVGSGIGAIHRIFVHNIQCKCMCIANRTVYNSTYMYCIYNVAHICICVWVCGMVMEYYIYNTIQYGRFECGYGTIFAFSRFTYAQLSPFTLHPLYGSQCGICHWCVGGYPFIPIYTYQCLLYI